MTNVKEIKNIVSRFVCDSLNAIVSKDIVKFNFDSLRKLPGVTLSHR